MRHTQSKADMLLMDMLPMAMLLRQCMLLLHRRYTLAMDIVMVGAVLTVVGAVDMAAGDEADIIANDNDATATVCYTTTLSDVSRWEYWGVFGSGFSIDHRSKALILLLNF